MRTSAEQRKARRRNVEDMIGLGLSQRQIAQRLQIDKETVNNDLKAIRAKNRAMVTDHEPCQVVADALNLYTNLEQKSLIEFDDAEKSRDKGTHLKNTGKFREKGIKLRQEVGLLPKNALAPAQEDEDEYKDWSLIDMKLLTNRLVLDLLKTMKKYQMTLSAVDVWLRKDPDFTDESTDMIMAQLRFLI